MTSKILTGTDNYYIYIITGVNVKSLEKINYESIGVYGFKGQSRMFNKLLKEIEGLLPSLKRTTEDNRVSEFDLFYHFKCQKHSFVLYSTDEKLLNKFYEFLLILQPSNIRPWVYFTAQYQESNENDLVTSQFGIGSVSLWNIIKSVGNSQQFVLRSGDYLIANRLLTKYFSFAPSSRFKHILGLYVNAYVEDNIHFKYLMLFMILESLIDDSDKTSIAYKIKRMCAVLVAEDIEFCRVLFKKIGDAYAVRSTLVHAGKSQIQKDMLIFVHSLVCEVVISNMLVEPVQSVFLLTHESGYGTKRQLINDNTLKRYTQLSRNRHNLKMIKTR
jgi:hypothetical protein